MYPDVFDLDYPFRKVQLLPMHSILAAVDGAVECWSESRASMMSEPEVQSIPNPWEGGAYSVKRHGISLANCELEPIQTPGCIQAHGVLLVLRLPDLTILQVSENSALWLGLEPEALLDRPLAEAIGVEGQARIRQGLEGEPVECNPLYMLTLPARSDHAPLDVSFHTIGGIGILELEATGSGTVEPSCYRLLKTTLAHLQSADGLAEFCGRVAAECRAMTGLDRVMVYRLHVDHHGEVIAESRRADLPAWQGLHYPAADIPASVRAIFKRIWVRCVRDAGSEPVELVPLVSPDSGRPPELTYCALRGASRMYTQYLRNLGAMASLTMPVLKDGELWGLIVCHHQTPTALSYQMRTACELLAQSVSVQIKSIEEREQLLYRLRLDELHDGLIAAAGEGEGRLEALIEGRPNLLDGIAAGGAALYHGGRWWLCGQTPDALQLDALAAWLEGRSELGSATRPIYVTEELGREYPGGAALAESASGVLAVSLSRKHRILMLWFRPETPQTRRWAGSPHDRPTETGPTGPRQVPRASFELFVETLKGRSRPWKEVEIEAALRLRLSVMELVVDRGERLAQLNAELARVNRELDTFTYAVGYDLKEPLRGMRNHLRRLLEHEDVLDEELRQRLNRLMRLAGRMDSLLGALLRFSRIGREPLETTRVEMGALVEEALTMAGARLAGSPVDVQILRPLPAAECDGLRIREVLFCLIDNAIRFNDREPSVVEIGCLPPGELDMPPGLGARALVFYVRDNGIGIEPVHWDRIFGLFQRLHAWEAYGGGAGAGLAIARLLIERHEGRLWLESTPGVGSCFYFSLRTPRSGAADD